MEENIYKNANVVVIDDVEEVLRLVMLIKYHH